MASKDELVSAWRKEVAHDLVETSHINSIHNNPYYSRGNLNRKKGKPLDFLNSETPNAFLTYTVNQGIRPNSKHQEYYTPNRRHSAPVLVNGRVRRPSTDTPNLSTSSKKNTALPALDPLTTSSKPPRSVRALSSVDRVAVTSLTLQRTEEMIPHLLEELYRSRQRRQDVLLEIEYLRDQVELLREEKKQSQQRYDRSLQYTVVHARREEKIDTQLRKEMLKHRRLQCMTESTTHRLKQSEQEAHYHLEGELDKCVERGVTAVYAGAPTFNAAAYQKRISHLKAEKKKLEEEILSVMAERLQQAARDKEDRKTTREKTEEELREDLARASKGVEDLKEKCLEVQREKKQWLREIAQLKSTLRLQNSSKNAKADTTTTLTAPPVIPPLNTGSPSRGVKDENNKPHHQGNTTSSKETAGNRTRKNLFTEESTSTKDSDTVAFADSGAEEEEVAIFLTEGAVDKYL